ncbi:MAG TPA: hypothetical protein PL033_15555 [Candidatus Brocadiia bacterium]|nr:hypothetical protein [Candidatus Brocadiia bacterium]
MSIRIGFAEADITPPVGIRKIGMLKEVISDHVLDPLFARIAVIANERERIAFIQLDTLSIRWTQVNDIRNRVQARYGFPGANIMVAATHNHAGPPVANCGDVPRDEAYIETMTAKVVDAFGRALESSCEAEIGFGRFFEFNVGFDRRVVMRNGTTRTHGRFEDGEALYVEGPVDPEFFVIAARKKSGELIGSVVNFACHPAHNGGGGALSAGFPGVLDRLMKQRGCPFALFLNGACGNITTYDRSHGGATKEIDEVGLMLADDLSRVLEKMEYSGSVNLGTASETIQLPYRKVGDAEIAGLIPGAQRFADGTVYGRGMDALLKRIEERKTQPAEVQALLLDNYAFVGIPAEYFSENGLKIKEGAYPANALVVSHANGMVGYVPHKEAFKRGGYETTFAAHSRMAPEAGDILAETAINLIRKCRAGS